MIYKEFKLGVVSRDSDTGKYSGEIENSADYLKLEVDTFGAIESTFHEMIDKYLEECKNIGRDPFIKERKSLGHSS